MQVLGNMYLLMLLSVLLLHAAQLYFFPVHSSAAVSVSWASFLFAVLLVRSDPFVVVVVCLTRAVNELYSRSQFL